MTRIRSAQFRTRPSLQPLEARDLPSFLPPASYTVDGLPYNVAIGELNGDGRRDVVVTDTENAQVLVYLGDGTGSLGGPTPFATGTTPAGIRVVDINADAKLDIVAVNYGSDTVSVLLGNGNGTFQAKLDFAANDKPFRVSIGEFNGDSNRDLAVTNLGDFSISGKGTTVSVLLGNGNGTFSSPSVYTTEPNPWGVQAADFNGDGYDDLTVTSEGNGPDVLSVFLNRGDGTFLPKQDYPVSAEPRDHALADFNRDGRLDVVVGNGDVTGNNESTVSVLLGNGDGTFQPQLQYLTGFVPWAVVTGDFNRDRKPDIATSSWFDGSVSVLLGNADGTFQAHIDYPAVTKSSGLAVGDLTNDRYPDLVVTDQVGRELSVLVNDGSWTAPVPLPPVRMAEILGGNWATPNRARSESSSGVSGLINCDATAAYLARGLAPCTALTDSKETPRVDDWVDDLFSVVILTESFT